jgi:hypothetical protein
MEVVVSGRKLLGECRVKRLPRKVVQCNLKGPERRCPDTTVHHDVAASHQFLHNPDSLEDRALEERDECLGLIEANTEFEFSRQFGFWLS